RILGNYIGTDRSGLLAIPNQSPQGGVVVQSTAAQITIGGGSQSGGTLISGNTASGIYSAGASLVISGNYIGTDVTGQASLANGADGVRLNGGTVTDVGDSTGTMPNS